MQHPVVHFKIKPIAFGDRLTKCQRGDDEWRCICSIQVLMNAKVFDKVNIHIFNVFITLHVPLMIT